ncbi:MAG: hypothetical protein ACRDJW_15790 [Thermomicrobiales bacterium]
MDEAGPRRFDRRRVVTAAISFGATFPLVLGYSNVQARRAGTPRVIALGAGDDLSVLVTAGPARLLIATGTDTTAFGNAFASALPFGLRRVDVVLLAGRGRSATVAAHAARSVHGRAYAIIDPGLPTVELALPNNRLEILSASRRYHLPGGVSVTVETTFDDQRSGWRAMIARGQTRIAVLPDGRISDLLPPHDPVSALIVTGDHPADAIQATRTPAVVVNADAVTEDALREGLTAASRSDLLVTSVFAGQAKAIAFVDGGIRLPDGTRSRTKGDASATD